MASLSGISLRRLARVSQPLSCSRVAVGPAMDVTVKVHAQRGHFFKKWPLSFIFQGGTQIHGCYRESHGTAGPVGAVFNRDMRCPINARQSRLQAVPTRTFLFQGGRQPCHGCYLESSLDRQQFQIQNSLVDTLVSVPAVPVGACSPDRNPCRVEPRRPSISASQPRQRFRSRVHPRPGRNLPLRAMRWRRGSLSFLFQGRGPHPHDR